MEGGGGEEGKGREGQGRKGKGWVVEEGEDLDVTISTEKFQRVTDLHVNRKFLSYKLSRRKYRNKELRH